MEAPVNPRIIGFIPARSGSKRIPNKNIRSLHGHPLIAYSIRSAIQSGIFQKVVCVTDSPLYAEVATYYGAEVPVLRPDNISGDKSPDIEWVLWILQHLESFGESFDAMAILRPTSPLRNPETIRKAFSILQNTGAHSVRAVEKCGQHPGKMWVINGDLMQPLMPFKNQDTPWHSSQYAALPEIYVQNASLEIAWVKEVRATKSIAGNIVAPLITPGYEGADVNEEFDWAYIEDLIASGKVTLPAFDIKPWSK